MAAAKQETTEKTEDQHMRAEFDLQKTLSCELTDPELLDVARLAGDQKIELDFTTVEAKEEATANKTRISSLQSRFDLSMEKIQIGREERNIVVRVTHDYEDGLYIEVRTDTDEEIARRPLRESECQQVIPGIEDSGDAGGPEDSGESDTEE